jgi:hypothetical protein
MILDHRTYELHPGKLREFLTLYEAEGFPVQTRHLGKPFAFFTTEVGNVNEIIHIWAYADFADRQSRRAAMQADPAWQAYLAKASSLFKRLRNSIVLPTSFAPIK